MREILKPKVVLKNSASLRIFPHLEVISHYSGGITFNHYIAQNPLICLLCGLWKLLYFANANFKKEV
jgi:hypothetical protein